MSPSLRTKATMLRSPPHRKGNTLEVTELQINVPVLWTGKLSKETHANGSSTEYFYDRAGNLSTIIDPEGNITDYQYDILGRLVKVKEPLGAITDYSYDRHGNLLSITDAEANETTYIYDDLGRIVEELSPDRGRTTYCYDSAGNLISRTDARGITARYDYDVLNRLTAIHYPDPDESEDILFTYDQGLNGKGKRTGIIDESGTTTFTYDSRGRLTGKESAVMGKSFVFSRVLSPSGRVMEVEYPSGRVLRYTRDSMGRMQALTMIKDTASIPLVTGMTYNPFGGPKGLSTGYGGEVNNFQGECGCLEVANPGQQMERIYSYDNNRNLISITATNTPWYNQSFTNDALQRLTQAQGWYGSLSYAYDRVGNRLSREVNTMEEVYSYDDGSNRLKDIAGPEGTTTFLYDAAGNTTAIGDKELSYNDRGRLEMVEDGQDNILGEYLYNALGQRVVKKAGGKTAILIYDLDGNLIGEADENGNVTSEYLYMGKIRVAKVDLVTATMYYYMNDRLGVPQLMVDEWGEIVWSAMYKPFGGAQVHPNSLVDNNFRLPGQYYDEETGLHYNYHRYYDPNSGRYITPDPTHSLDAKGEHIPFLVTFLIETPERFNSYSYVANNPMNSFDILGLFDLFGRTAWRWSGIRFENPINREIRAFQSAIENELTATATYGKCTAICIGKVALQEIGARLLQAGILSVAKKMALRGALKLIPIGGWVSTIYSGYSGIKCFVFCASCE